jgi:acylphosphatase
MAARIARGVLIYGRVQGVWFRDSARHEASSRRVDGWARNRSDGAVQIWLEGPPDAVEAVIAWCHRGPPRADVQRVEVSDDEPRGLDGFEVR